MTTVLHPAERATQKVILHNVSWETYLRLLSEHQEDSSTHFTYDRGALEIMVLSFRHERLKHTLSTLVELLAAELEIDLEGAGSTTFRREDLQRGFEPDACFYVAHAEYIRRKDEIDLTVDPPPDLIIEIDITSPSLDKLPLFVALGVPEVWRYDSAGVRFFRLGADEYIKAQESAALPGVTGEMVNRLLGASQKMKRADWLRLVRETVKKD